MKQRVACTLLAFAIACSPFSAADPGSTPDAGVDASLEASAPKSRSDDASVDAGPCVCPASPPTGFKCFSDNCHLYRNITQTGISFEDAHAGATAIPGGYLVTITSEKEDQFVASLLGNDPNVVRWIGAQQALRQSSPSEGWSWLDGEPWSYVNWQEGEPNDDDGVEDDQEDFAFTTGKGQWIDDGPDKMTVDGYIVEMNP
jgi:hypothetical protein